jgi:prolyl oligopeptidase
MNYIDSRATKTRRHTRAGVIGAFWLLLCAPTIVSLPAAAAPPPSTDIQPATDTYFDTKVVDPYRWLEDASSSKVEAWNNEQNAYARAYLDALAARKPLKQRLTALITATSPSYSELRAAGGELFALYNDPKFQQPMLVSLDVSAKLDTKKTVLDPNHLDAAGRTAIDWFMPSHDGTLVAVSLSQGGSENGTLHIYNAATGDELGETIPRVQYPTAGGSLAWAADNKSFWYTRYPGEERPEADRHFFMQVFFHTIGTDWAKDPLVLGTEDGIPRIGEIFLDNRYAPDAVLASVQKGDGGEWAQWVLGAQGKKTKFAAFEDRIVAATLAPDHSLYLISLKKAPNGLVLKLAPGAVLAEAKVIVPEAKSALIVQDRDTPRAPTLTASTMLLSYIEGGPTEVRAFSLDGKPEGKLPFGEIASLGNLEALPGGDVLIQVQSYLRLPYYARWRAASGQVEETELAARGVISFDDAEVVRAFATSKDGTKVPISIIRKKGLKPDGKTPVLLYGYGGYGVSMEPHFLGAFVRLWLDGGGIYTEANIRGGAEYGQRWHEEGRLLKKQNVFDDFAAAGQEMIKLGYTDHDHLALRGGSNGGLLMGAEITQHPDLARAVVSSVGIYDMLRVELDPNGSFNTTEFGTVKDPRQFQALYAYSPYHHVKAGMKYPAVLMLTGANDGRVNPMQSRKFAAALQVATGSGLPVLLRISTTSGHGIGSSLSERIDQQADQLAFLYDQLGMTVPPQE